MLPPLLQTSGAGYGVSQPQGVILRGGPAQGGDHHRAACCHEGELDGLGGARGVYCIK